MTASTKNMDMLATSIRAPTVDEIKSLTLSDLAVASALADVFRERMREHVRVDPYCVADPFSDKDDCTYSVVLDRENPNRVIAMIATKKDPLPQLPWHSMTGDRLVRVTISKGDAATIKKELMPKETYNFYPYRRGDSVAGYVMFAFEICGLR